jgi:putative DNA primase/helicase
MIMGSNGYGNGIDPLSSQPWRESAHEYHQEKAQACGTSAATALTEVNEEAVDSALREPEINAHIVSLAELPRSVYETRRIGAAKQLGMRASVLDSLVKEHGARAEQNEAELPHWKVDQWPDPVPCAKLLDAIRQVFRRYIVLPKGADDALALWTLHAWTFDAGEICPFLVLISPTKRCGKTSVLILLLYLTPRSELASNISPSALFRYIEDVKPTLLIDEADSFLGDNEEMRGILNSGHTKAAAHVIRNVEVNGEHKPRRFSTWTPKAIATIRKLADTLQDRSVLIELQRKPKGARVERLRRRDSEEFAELRSRAARWAADNVHKLSDPDPAVPESLNDRAADNWRPLLAIADLAGKDWGARARQAACILSGGEDDDSAANVQLLAHIREAFGELDVIRSVDLITGLTTDPEKPWGEWRRGKPITQKQLAGLLRPFDIISETVHPPGLPHGKGYKRASFEPAWERYLRGQNTPSDQVEPSEACKRANADEMGISGVFSSVQESLPHGSKNGNLYFSHAGLHACTHENPETDCANDFDQRKSPAQVPAKNDPWADLDIPSYLDRRPHRPNPPALGPSGDSLDDFQ